MDSQVDLAESTLSHHLSNLVVFSLGLRSSTALQERYLDFLLDFVDNLGSRRDVWV